MIGAFRYQIDLLERTEVPDGAGGVAAAFLPVRKIWAGVELLSSIAAPHGDRTRRIRRLKAWVRTRPGLDPGARLRFQEIDYEIVSVESEDERGRRAFLICEEVL